METPPVSLYILYFKIRRKIDVADAAVFLYFFFLERNEVVCEYVSFVYRMRTSGFYFLLRFLVQLFIRLCTVCAQ